jgi:hypothetical protein
VNAGLPPRRNPCRGRAPALPHAGRSLPQPAGAPPRPAGAPLTPAGAWPSPFSGQVAGAWPAAGWARSRLGVAHPERSAGLGLDRWKPAPLLHWDSTWPGWGVLAPGSPWGRTGAPAPRAAHGSRVAAEGEHGDSAGWAGGYKPQQGAARRVRKPRSGWSRGRRPTARAAQRSASQRGCRGVRPPTLRMEPGSPAWGGGSPPRRLISGALTGPPLAALTGRAASRAERRWRHTALPPGGRMGQSKEPKA